MNLEKRIEQLERAIEAATQEHIIAVRLIVVHSRQEAEALAALRESEPPADRPQPRGRVRLEVVESIDARTHLAQRGVLLPAPESDAGGGNGPPVLL